MKKQLILFVLFFCCFSCAAQKKEIIAKSTIKLEGRNTNIRDLIEGDGYYQDQDYSTAMFFEDGTYVSSFSFKEDIPENEIRANMSKSIHSWIENKQVRWGFYWGVYKIERDTIVVYYYLRGNWWVPWIFAEKRYKVIERTTILPIYSKGLLKTHEQYDKEFNVSPWKSGSNLYFTSSDCWLKEEKWIWRNELDWKAYMQKIERKKIKEWSWTVISDDK